MTKDEFGDLLRERLIEKGMDPNEDLDYAGLRKLWFITFNLAVEMLNKDKPLLIIPEKDKKN